MPIAEDIRKALYRRCGGQCECDMAGCKSHEPRRRCSNHLYSDSWGAFRIRPRGGDQLRNLRAVCPDCLKRIQSMPGAVVLSAR
jgi:hypothetical protein